MCRLMALTAGIERVHATYWLLDAPDSLEVESRRNVDGTGIGYFDANGVPVLDKRPEPAYRDPDFIRVAIDTESEAFVGHVRLATVGERSALNTHPFTMGGRIMAHNGGFGELTSLEAELGEYRGLVHGDTDSERFFALITQQIDVHAGDVAAGITAAARWIAARLPVTSLNAVVVAPGELWALRYPGQHALHVLATSVHGPDLDGAPTVVVASEEMDGVAGWRMLDVGELIHVGPDLQVTSTIVLPEPPVRLVPLPGRNPNIDT